MSFLNYLDGSGNIINFIGTTVSEYLDNDLPEAPVNRHDPPVEPGQDNVNRVFHQALVIPDGFDGFDGDIQNDAGVLVEGRQALQDNFAEVPANAEAAVAVLDAKEQAYRDFRDATEQAYRDFRDAKEQAHRDFRDAKEQAHRDFRDAMEQAYRDLLDDDDDDESDIRSDDSDDDDDDDDDDADAEAALAVFDAMEQAYRDVLDAKAEVYRADDNYKQAFKYVMDNNGFNENLDAADALVPPQEHIEPAEHD